MTTRLPMLMETVPDTDVVASMLPAFAAEHPEVAVDLQAMHYDDLRGPFDALHAGAGPLVAGANAEDVIVAVGQELHPAAAGTRGVDEAVARAARRAQGLLAGDQLVMTGAW
jgi:hypothetical protein